MAIINGRTRFERCFNAFYVRKRLRDNEVSNRHDNCETVKRRRWGEVAWLFSACSCRWHRNLLGTCERLHQRTSPISVSGDWDLACQAAKPPSFDDRRPILDAQTTKKRLFIPSAIRWIIS